MCFDGQELATRWSIVARLRNPGFSWDDSTYKANRNGSGVVEGLRSYPQALIPVLDMAPSGFTNHASMKDALQAVRKTHEVFGQISDAQLWVMANTTSECCELEDPFALVRREKSQTCLAEANILQRRGKLSRWVAGESESRSTQL